MADEIKNTVSENVGEQKVLDAPLHQAISARFPKAKLCDSSPDIPSYKIGDAEFVDLMTFLRDDEQCRFDYPLLCTGVDWMKENRIEVTYHLMQSASGRKVAVKVDLDRDKPVMPSAATIYRSFDWHERETAELLGIVFEGHPDLRKLLLDDSYTGFPLRKDYEDEEHEFIKRP